ncbi:hypothetical protein [Salinilacihabitans rarus]|uniref:hypothetical protein n=1 Tax=Salinilacihabitans rarus TaxID=2961596 RepID=UPI0020C85907|nr:hypothetical protein [Salinilacihabitans rarus]
MVSRENRVVASFVALALALTVLAVTVTDWGSRAVVAILLVVGVFLPQAVTASLNRG